MLRRLSLIAAMAAALAFPSAALAYGHGGGHWGGHGHWHHGGWGGYGGGGYGGGGGCCGWWNGRWVCVHR